MRMVHQRGRDIEYDLYVQLWIKLIMRAAHKNVPISEIILQLLFTK